MVIPVNDPTTLSRQALLFFNDQSFVPGACLYARLNLIGALILWELASRNLGGRPLPALFLYGADRERLRQTAHNVTRIAGKKAKEVRIVAGSGLHSDTSQILITEITTRIGNLDLCRYPFIVMYGTDHPAAQFYDSEWARRILPVRIATLRSFISAPVDFGSDPNPVELLCDVWLKINGGPYHQDRRGFCWPVESSTWRALVQDVLTKTGWHWQPDSIATLGDI